MPVDFILFFVWGWYKDSMISALTSTDPVRIDCAYYIGSVIVDHIYLYVCVYILYIYIYSMYMCTHAHSCTSLASLPLYWWILKLCDKFRQLLFYLSFFSGSRRSVLSVLTQVLRGLCSSPCITHPSLHLRSSCILQCLPQLLQGVKGTKY